MSKKKKNIPGTIIRLLVVCVILGIIFTKIDFNKTASIITNASSLFLLASFGLFMLNRVLAAVKWDIILRSNNIRAGLPALIRITLESSFLGFVVPSGIDIVRLVQLGNREKNLTASTSSILVDRMVATATLGILSIIASVAGWSLIDDKSILLKVMAAGVVLITIVLMLMGRISFRIYRTIHDGFFKIIGRTDHPTSTRIKKKIEEIHEAFTIVLKTPSVLLTSLGINLVVQLVRVAQIHFLFKAGGMDIPIVFEIAFVPIITLISMVGPFMGLGLKEAAFIYFFGRISVPAELSVAVSLLSHAIVIAGLIPGAILFFVGPDRKKILEKKEQDE